ncbi:hypothetical protein A7U60_g1863 [Sanghuangporus baumii]|uniref:Uncharacterized protein n=1 Tax=Sanghuangporus baumii TaxID=108892 RepID=A0A9Q5N8T4_SANBA|nr:hypothetical protein A7U60_g1863 [Sanghuangporus baumii]
MTFPADESKLVSIFIQTLLYGAYTVVFILTVWVLLFKRAPREPINKTMLAISIVLFVLATMHIGVNYSRIFKAFITHRDAPGGPAAFFNQLSEFTQIFGSTIYVAQTLVGDGVVHRLAHPSFNQSTKEVIAFLVACGIGILYSFAKVVPEAEIFVNELQDWIVSFFSLTLATNIICTALVAARIWKLNRSIMSFASHSYRPIIILVIESGAVYSVTLLALLILYKAQSWFQYVLLDAGLVFSMIIVRIGLGITSVGGRTMKTADSYSTSRDMSNQTQSNTFGRVRLQFSRRHMMSGQEESIELEENESAKDESRPKHTFMESASSTV